MAGTLYFFGNPIIDTLARFPDGWVQQVLGGYAGPGHYPMEAILRLEAALPEVMFVGPSGGAFTAALAATRFYSKVQAWGAAGRDAEGFHSQAEQAGIRFIDPVGGQDVPAGRCIASSDIRGSEPEYGPFVNPGAAALFTPERMPGLSSGDLAFFEGFLIAGWGTVPDLGGVVCGVDVSSRFLAEGLVPHLRNIGGRSPLIVFATREEAEVLLGVPMESPENPGMGFSRKAQEFCQGRHTLIVKLQERGARIFGAPDTEQGEGIVIEPRPVPQGRVEHPMSAGDVFAGACMGALASGCTVVEAAEIGAVSSAVCVSRYGNRLP